MCRGRRHGRVFLQRRVHPDSRTWAARGVAGPIRAERAAGVQAVTVQVGWDDAEPTAGSLDPSYITGIVDQISQAEQQGLQVILDPGLQYPPNWLLAMPGSQFVNQYGDVFSAGEPSGENVVNGITDLEVRDAEGQYLAMLGAQLSGQGIYAVRAGGGPLGELRYPDTIYLGDTNSFWAYDPSTQAALPASVQGWIPGTGTVAQATTFLNAYNEHLDQYAQWLNGQLHDDFDTPQLLLMPGWGQRPGNAAAEEAALLQPVRPQGDPTKYDEYNQGLDWAGLLSGLPYPGESVAYTTYLDARSVEPTPQLEDPADYLASLVAGTSIRLGGENSGDDTVADLEFCASQAVRLGFDIMQWFDEDQLLATAAGTDPSGPTLAQLGRSLTAAAGPTPLSIVTFALPNGAQHQDYSTALAASGGQSPYTWSLASGSLPSGLTLNGQTGLVSGVIQSSGAYAVTFRVTDSAGDFTTVGLTITVALGSAPVTLARPVTAIAATADGGGYWIADARGVVMSFGDAAFDGSMAGLPLSAPVMAISPTPDGGGYWLVASDGGIFSFGDAQFYGSTGSLRLNKPVVGMAATPDGAGYWLVASDGGIFSFGDAQFYGSTGSLRLNKPVVGMAATPDGAGYWLVASDGGIFSFGDAQFYGSTGSLRLNNPVVGMAAVPDGAGYWLVASDGGIFSFGDAQFYGSTGSLRLDQPVVGMAAAPGGGGYWLVAADGGVFAAHAPFFGAA